MSTHIKQVSLTGPDDQTGISGLITLSRQYPLVEWALLYVPHNEGAPRNPTRAWRECFFAHRELAERSAVHLCGVRAFEQLLQGTLPADVLRAKRLQLNINARAVNLEEAAVLEVFERALDLGPDIILQYHPGTAAIIEQFLLTVPASQRHRVHILMDESRGLGKSPAAWVRPDSLAGFYVGYAGGIGPDNIAAVAREVEALGQACWVDMETRLRTNDQFDYAKVEAVLSALKVSQ